MKILFVFFGKSIEYHYFCTCILSAESLMGEREGATFMEKSVCLRSSATTRKLRNFTDRS